MIGLGIPYYYIQKPEKGYESRGSFWGFLWKYVKESETKYTEVSILGYVYSKVERDGKVTYRILGVRID